MFQYFLQFVFQYFLQLLSTPYERVIEPMKVVPNKYLWQTIPQVGECQFLKNPDALYIVEHGQGTQPEKTSPKHVLALQLGQLLCMPASLLVTVTILTTLR